MIIPESYVSALLDVEIWSMQVAEFEVIHVGSVIKGSRPCVKSGGGRYWNLILFEHPLLFLIWGHYK